MSWQYERLCVHLLTYVLKCPSVYSLTVPAEVPLNSDMFTYLLKSDVFA